MKTLTILVLVQTGILLILLGKIVLFDEESTVLGDAEQYTSVGDGLANIPSQSSSIETHDYPDEDRLRQIIREELRAHLDSQPGPEYEEALATALSSTDTAEYQHRRELVAQQLVYFSSVGSISHADMQMLQMEIAKLDEASQKEMLGKLTRALNSGELDGRL